MTEQPEAFELPFARMNETDVRAEVLDPLLKRLGYAMSGNALVRREHPVSYPNLYLGRKKPDKDLTLRGIADYTLEVTRHARWTLEAKAPSVALDDEVVQQAWSYAIHPEIQSSYFAVCNGRMFELYSTSSAWGAEPLLRLTHQELESRFPEVAAYLGPDAIARHHPNHLESAGKPLAPGLRSFARVSSGTISYDHSTLSQPLLSQMQVSIVDGTLRRDTSGRIQVQLQTRGPFREVQERIEQLGLSVQTYETDDEYLSLLAGEPTTLTFFADMAVPVAMDPQSYKPVPMESPPHVRVHARAIGHLSNEVFSGRFVNEMTFYWPDGEFKAIAEGTFQLRLG
jgi:hypothetical protein